MWANALKEWQGRQGGTTREWKRKDDRERGRERDRRKAKEGARWDFICVYMPQHGTDSLGTYTHTHTLSHAHTLRPAQNNVMELTFYNLFFFFISKQKRTAEFRWQMKCLLSTDSTFGWFNDSTTNAMLLLDIQLVLFAWVVSSLKFLSRILFHEW